MTIFPFDYLNKRLSKLDPKYRFSPHWALDPAAWQRLWRKQLRELMGSWPESCTPEPEWNHLSERDSFDLFRITYRTEKELRTFAFAAIPRDSKGNSKGKRPGVLCIHGHGESGAYPLMRFGDHTNLTSEIQQYGYDYGARFAEAGAVVLAPNLRCFGERLTKNENDASTDLCNVTFWHMMSLGELLLTAQLHDLTVALDLLAAVPEVNPERVGCAGLSYGGRLTMYLSALDNRIKAAIVSGALNSFVERVRSYQSCAAQIMPGLLKYGDVGDILGLIAPRLLTIERGRQDSFSPRDSAYEELATLQEVYKAFGAQGQLALFEFDGAHKFNGTSSIPWLMARLTE